VCLLQADLVQKAIRLINELVFGGAEHACRPGALDRSIQRTSLKEALCARDFFDDVLMGPAGSDASSSGISDDLLWRVLCFVNQGSKKRY
jgi:hypothetical protein